MKNLLIVEDDEAQRDLYEFHLKDYKVIMAENGQIAKDILMENKCHIDLILTDLQMPVMDGLQLLKFVVEEFSHIPVILNTAFDTSEVAVEAMKMGAADFLPKPVKREILLEIIIKNINNLIQEKNRDALHHHLKGNFSYNLHVNEHHLISCLVNNLSGMLVQTGFIPKKSRYSIKTVLAESFTNAFFHGALDIPSKGFRENGMEPFIDEINRRAFNDDLYKNNYIDVSITIGDDFSIVIDDYGKGFDWKVKLNEAKDPMNFLRPFGRGIMLMKGMMGDLCKYNDIGNQLTLIFHRDN